MPDEPSDNGVKKPVLARRSLHKKSTIFSGRTIGAAREHLETANERASARKKDKHRKAFRIILVSCCFLALIVILILLANSFLSQKREESTPEPTPEPVADKIYTPTIEVVDENPQGNGITNRMKEYIGMIESDLKDLGYKATKAVLPAGSIREVDFYLEGHPGYIKTVIDRDAAVTVEDLDRMIRYLTGQGITEYEYIDVRIDGRAFWK